MSYAAQLEHEAEQTRSQLLGTLAELRASVTPGRVIDQVADYAGNGDASQFFRTLRHQIARNPLPVTLIGMGVAWLTLANGRGGDANGSDGGGQVAKHATSMAERAEQETGALLQRTGETVADAKEAAGRAARSAYDKMTGGAGRTASAVAGSARSFGSRATTASRSAVEFCREEPLVLAGLGLAIGAVVGALFQTTRAEDRLMGARSDEVKAQARDVDKTNDKTNDKMNDKTNDKTNDKMNDKTNDKTNDKATAANERSAASAPMEAGAGLPPES